MSSPTAWRVIASKDPRYRVVVSSRGPQGPGGVAPVGFIADPTLQQLIDGVNPLFDNPATETVLGGVKVGAGLSVTSDGTVSADVQESDLVALASAIDEESARAEAAEAAIEARVSTLEAQGGGGGTPGTGDVTEAELSAAVSVEAAARLSADESLASRVSDLDEAATNVQSAIEELDAEKEPVIVAGTTYQVYRGDKSFGTVGLSLTTAQLLALSGADAAMLRFAYCTDCYNLTGTLTGGAVFYDSGTSKWRLTCCSVEVTASMLTFFRGLRERAVTSPMSGKLWANPVYFRSTRNTAPSAINSGYFSLGVVSGVIGMSLTTSSSATGGAGRSSFADVMTPGGYAGWYHSTLAAMGASGFDSGQPGSAFFGVCSRDVVAGVQPNMVGFFVDPTNATGVLGANNGNLHAISRKSGVTTVQDTGVALPLGTSYVLCEVHATPASVAYYINGNIVATITTNLITTEGSMQFNEWILKASGTTSRTLWVGDRYEATISP